LRNDGVLLVPAEIVCLPEEDLIVDASLDHGLSFRLLGRAAHASLKVSLQLGYVMAGDLPTARRLLERYKEDFPGDPTVDRAAAVLFAAEGELDKGIAMLETLKGGVDTPTRSRLEILQLMAGNWQRVRELTAIDEVQASPTDWPDMAAKRAQAAIGEGQLGEAIAELSEAANLVEETYLRSNSSHWMALVGRLQAVIGRAELGIESARKGIAIDPFWSQNYFDLGELQIAVGDPEGARQTLEELSRINQDAVTVAGRFWESLLRAEIERTAGNLDLAQKAINQIDAMAPEYRWAHFEHIGRRPEPGHITLAQWWRPAVQRTFGQVARHIHALVGQITGRGQPGADRSGRPGQQGSLQRQVSLFEATQNPAEQLLAGGGEYRQQGNEHQQDRPADDFEVSQVGAGQQQHSHDSDLLQVLG
jgi:tetratricopeptide (TPR) repeat protein